MAQLLLKVDGDFVSNFVHGKVPWYAWLLLVIALLAVSSGAAIFELIDSVAEREYGAEEGVPPLLLASWRLQATSLVLFPLFIWQWFTASRELKERFVEPRTMYILAGSGVFLTLHFGTWLMSLKLTTLTHSLLFVTAHPLVIVFGLWIIGKSVEKRKVLGVIIGFIGAAIAIIGGSSESGVSVFGNLLAFMGAVTYVGYLTAGRVLRRWLPIFLYAFPVTFISCILLMLWSLIVENSDFSFLEVYGVLGWANIVFIPLIFLIAIGPGLLGHTGLNTCLRWMSPLIISVVMIAEPVIGSLLGWMLGVEDIPGGWTWVGGSLMLTGMVLVTISSESMDYQSSESE